MSNNSKLNKELDEVTCEKILKKQLPPNAWMIEGDSSLLKELNSCNSIISDLEYVKSSIKELEIIRKKELKNNKEENKVIKKALFTSSIITYGRCFNITKNDERNRLKVKFIKSKFPKNEIHKLDVFIEFHKYIMCLRSKFVAHADKNIFEIEKAYIKFDFEIEAMSLNYSFNSVSVSMYNFNESQLNNFKVLIDYLIIISNEKKDILIEKVKEEIGEDKLNILGIKLGKKRVDF